MDGVLRDHDKIKAKSNQRVHQKKIVQNGPKRSINRYSTTCVATLCRVMVPDAWFPNAQNECNVVRDVCFWSFLSLACIS
jgi:hypothetical protein